MVSIPQSQDPVGARLPYVARPHYALPAGHRLQRSWAALAALVPESGVLALDGPTWVDWEDARQNLIKTLARRGVTDVDWVSMDAHYQPWDVVLERTDLPELTGDPDFAKLAPGGIGNLIRTFPQPVASGLTILAGPGAGLAEVDTLWWLDAPKRIAEAQVTAGHGRNLAAPEEVPATARRLFYIDWPLLDRHRDALLARLDMWVDVQGSEPLALTGPGLRESLRMLAHQPFRTLTTFNSTSWGGHWAQKELGHNEGAVNTALGYELIAPESGVLVGTTGEETVELPFQLVVAAHPREILGEDPHLAFGTSFPIRFDYLDTYGGGSLSVHCHPQEQYMQSVFGWPYTQHETYYVMKSAGQTEVFLGLHEEADVATFRRAAHAANDHGEPFDIEQFVQFFPAEEHQLFLIPAGTPHGSGQGNVVLEVSATPYLYSLRFYDWLREDQQHRRRLVHVRHAFANLDESRRGEHVAKHLVPRPVVVRTGAGWTEEVIGDLADMFFVVNRLQLEAGACAPVETSDRFHVLTVVEGPGVQLTGGNGTSHQLAYAETMVVPASVGSYQVTGLGRELSRVVWAAVR